MRVSKNHSVLLNQEVKAKTFNLTDLIVIIGYRLTAYIGGATSIQHIKEWLQNGLPPELESRMRTTFDVVKPIAEVESELIAQGFLIGQREETGSYRFPARMLRESDIKTARSVLMHVAAAEFLSNEVPNINDVESRLQAWIKNAEFPENVGYTCHLWKGQLSLTLVHAGFSENVQRKWDCGADWPCWDQILATVPEMAGARSEIDLTTGFPFKYLRPQLSQPTSNSQVENIIPKPSLTKPS
jgi:hypothetical protein